jgi:hypothetical protein
MLLGLIIACEIGFWVLIGAGLTARYLLRCPRLGAALLVSVPLVDLILLIATVIDLRSGATAGFTHGLAAAYIGFSLAFGHSVIRWADARFAHRFAGGPPPPVPARHGRERARREWRDFGKAFLAWAISCALLAAAILAVGSAERTQALEVWIVRLTFSLAIWSLWPITATIGLLKPGRERTPRTRPTGSASGGVDTWDPQGADVTRPASTR